ncbi:P-loop containing nucleoside triphosphate hydrolase protein [Syncephalastrum racemosum]|uniref:DNA repair protein RAD51 homolog 3 n=1 Tax=Syncephalastrum racemosum TaxID=13706 RepID=A0A1X2HVC1_SYNRA|nr:P-loop containing nucleoside triphosphate hydrolase protein [Syncephalastrum racemosum]
MLAVNAQLPTSCGGLDGDCLYIDTEGGCLPARMREIARGMKERFPDLIDNVLSKIHYLRIMNHMQLVALMYQLPDIIKEYPKTKLVIIDSIAFPFKLAVRPCLRDKLLRLIARTLKDIATDKKLAVVVTNQVIQDRGTKQLTPALGELWGDWCTNRMFLFRKRHAR